MRLVPAYDRTLVTAKPGVTECIAWGMILTFTDAGDVAYELFVQFEMII